MPTFTNTVSSTYNVLYQLVWFMSLGSTVAGVAWLYVMSKYVRQLQALPVSAWRISTTAGPLGGFTAVPTTDDDDDAAAAAAAHHSL